MSIINFAIILTEGFLASGIWFLYFSQRRENRASEKLARVRLDIIRDAS